jgi:formylglycine-generating enzyme required for sulfatase activity
VQLTRGFDMLATEVTVEQFRRFSEAKDNAPPRQPAWNTDRHPLVNVTWDEARAFCDGVGGRLPTEVEWEYAARGGKDGLLFPWGNEFDRNLANATGREGRDVWETTAPVGSFPSNGYGLFDMVGNVWEWTVDRYAGDRYERDLSARSPSADSTRPSPGTWRVIRGGSWDSEPERLILSFRSSLTELGRPHLYVGFRCARDAGRP